jgi:hypothetical protein
MYWVSISLIYSHTEVFYIRTTQIRTKNRNKKQLNYRVPKDIMIYTPASKKSKKWQPNNRTEHTRHTEKEMDPKFTKTENHPLTTSCYKNEPILKSDYLYAHWPPPSQDHSYTAPCSLGSGHPAQAFSCGRKDRPGTHRNMAGNLYPWCPNLLYI